MKAKKFFEKIWGREDSIVDKESMDAVFHCLDAVRPPFRGEMKMSMDIIFEAGAGSISLGLDCANEDPGVYGGGFLRWTYDYEDDNTPYVVAFSLDWVKGCDWFVTYAKIEKRLPSDIRSFLEQACEESGISWVEEESHDKGESGTPIDIASHEDE
jgi:hypothetical protein